MHFNNNSRTPHVVLPVVSKRCKNDGGGVISQTVHIACHAGDNVCRCNMKGYRLRIRETRGAVKKTISLNDGDDR